MTIKAQAVLQRIGFLPDHAGPAAGYSFDFGSMRLQGMACMNLRVAEVLLFTGVWSDARTIAQVRFETPLVFDSYEQGVAWIAEGIGRGFRPASPVAWLEQGRAWRDHLPWVRQQVAYDARPRCTVERDWFRAPAARLRALAERANEADLATVAFDGHVLTIVAQSSHLPMPAEGSAWSEEYCVLLQHLGSLPKRLMNPAVDISVWEGRLSIARLSLPLVLTENEVSAA